MQPSRQLASSVSLQFFPVPGEAVHVGHGLRGIEIIEPLLQFLRGLGAVGFGNLL